MVRPSPGTHMKAFTAALETMNKPRFMIGRIPPTSGLVDQFFNTSTGLGEDGEFDARGPWNEGNELQLVDAPAFQALAAGNGRTAAEAGVDDRTTSTGPRKRGLTPIWSSRSTSASFADC